MIFGIILGFGAAFSQSLAFLLSRFFIDKYHRSYMQLLALSHVIMGVFSLILVPFLWPQQMPAFWKYFPSLFGCSLFYMLGQNLTASANIGIVYGFTPLLILVVAVIARIEKPSLYTTIGVLAGCLGLFIVLFPGGRFTIDTG